MQNLIQKFRQSSVVFQKLDILSEKWKTLTSPNYHRLQYILLKFCTRSLLTNVYKRVREIFLFYLEYELFVKIKNNLVSTHSQKPRLSITQDLNKIKKWHTTFCRYSDDGNVYKILAKNIKLFGSWNSSKFSIFQTNNLVSLKYKSFV